jgi:hypothetical protein
VCLNFYVFRWTERSQKVLNSSPVPLAVTFKNNSSEQQFAQPTKEDDGLVVPVLSEISITPRRYINPRFLDAGTSWR